MSATTLAIQLLLQDATVAGLVAGAVLPVEAPQDQALPYVVVRVLSEDAGYVIAGDTGAFDNRVEVACHGRTFAQSDAIGEAVKAALINNVNRAVSYGDGSPPDVIGIATTWKAPGDVSDFSRDRSVFRRIMDFRLRWWLP